jgi:trans-aconitate methyltransferase
MIKNVNYKDFESLLGFAGEKTKKLLKNGVDLRILNANEIEEAFLCHEEIMKKTLDVSGPKRFDAWQNGWTENLNDLATNSSGALVPKYFGKYKYIRFQQEFYLAEKEAELKLLQALLLNEVEIVLSDFLPNHIIEFGCGTGHNLFFLHSKIPELKFVGSDWTSSSAQIIELAKEKYNTPNIVSGQIFDYFRPDYRFKLDEKDLVITVASLEQVGTNHKSFIDFLIHKRPKRVLHIEPEADLLDSKNRYDKSSIDYIKMRGYLSGFLAELKVREAKGQIKILRCQRSFIGSFPMDGYSIFVWEPVYEF